MTDSPEFPITHDEFNRLGHRAKSVAYHMIRQLFALQVGEFPDRPDAQEESAPVITGFLAAAVKMAMDSDDLDDAALREQLISQIDYQMAYERSVMTTQAAGAPHTEGNA